MSEWPSEWTSKRQTFGLIFFARSANRYDRRGSQVHDHLDGGLRPATIVELAEAVGYRNLPKTDPARLAAWFREAADSPAREGGAGLERYLETFVHTCAVMQTREALFRVAAECAQDLAADGVRGAGVDADGEDLGVVVGGGFEGLAGLEVCCCDPCVEGVVPEGVVRSGVDDARVVGAGLDGEVDEVVVVVDDSGRYGL